MGQYDAAYQDSLRDDARTNLPIFTFNPATSTYTRAGLSSSNQFQLSGLFSYQPVPGTVVFLGYGNNLDEPEPFHFTGLRRTADRFFVKFSYLFRLWSGGRRRVAFFPPSDGVPWGFAGDH